MKASQDDWRIEQEIDSGHTLHAEELYGTPHPEEGGIPLKQQKPHEKYAALKTKLRPDHARDREFY
jgi:hypothetical protein